MVTSPDVTYFTTEEEISSQILIDSCENQGVLRNVVTTFKSKVWTYTGFYNMNGTNEIDKDYLRLRNERIQKTS